MNTSTKKNYNEFASEGMLNVEKKKIPIAQRSGRRSMSQHLYQTDRQMKKKIIVQSFKKKNFLVQDLFQALGFGPKIWQRQQILINHLFQDFHSLSLSSKLSSCLSINMSLHLLISLLNSLYIYIYLSICFSIYVSIYVYIILEYIVLYYFKLLRLNTF